METFRKLALRRISERTLQYLIISSHRLTIILLCFHLVSLLSTLRRLTQLAMFLQQYTDTSPT